MGISAHKTLSRLAVYIVILAWITLGLYIFFASGRGGAVTSIGDYFTADEHFGIKLGVLALLAPFVLTAISYLIHDRAELFRKTLLAESELRQKTLELGKVNELLARENSARKKVEEQLKQHAFYDPLTGLPNRALFIDHLGNALERQKSDRKMTFAVLLLDIDRFKVINEGLGRAVGDQVLILLSQRLKSTVRPGDTVAHFGGDEFGLLMEDAGEKWYVDDLVERIHDETRSPFHAFGREIFASASIGIVIVKAGEYSQPEDLLRDADIAMYHAKSRGKSCHVIFDSAMQAEATTLLWLETEMRRGVIQNDFVAHYQPIFTVVGRKVVGFEALMRWQHPERGLMLPPDFVSVAEETGMIYPISYRIIHEACWQTKEWQRRFPDNDDLMVGVKISDKVFFQPDFYGIIEKILEETGLRGSSLRLEIIEKMLMEKPEPSADMMKRLKDLHVRIDIDGFGTGYSALNYLRHFPIDGLKIDPSFVKTLSSDRKNAEIVRSIITVAESLQLDVVAEGIETEQQLEMFRAMNGRYVQGFFVPQPLDSKTVESLLH